MAELANSRSSLESNFSKKIADVSNVMTWRLGAELHVFISIYIIICIYRKSQFS